MFQSSDNHHDEILSHYLGALFAYSFVLLLSVFCILGSNVLLDAKKDKVKLSDFDTSKLFEKLDASIKLSVQTNTGEKGSYYWMAPEVLCRGNKGEPGYHPEYGFRADIW